jgi:Leucine-rich repeat (LRR) protein
MWCHANRYFIVIDDIWDTSAWETIKFAFMDSNCGSRIISTTRNVDVSKACCSPNGELIYKMKPLSEGESKNLFYTRVFGTETGCPPQFEQLSRDILKKCGGVPLAIITLASHLASNLKKPEAHWHDLLKSIGRGLTNGGSVEEMKKILSLSYYDLPPHLKICVLYLCVFPEDYCIQKGRLIRRWIAEGFIQGDNLFDLGESYFNELVNRSIIQPIYGDFGGILEGCRVHDIMLDLLCDLASEENFVTILDVVYKDTTFRRKVRRLSLQKVELRNTQLATRCISQVRSFTIFSPAINDRIPLSRFGVLRVLDLEDCNLEESGNLNLCIGDLLHLRYLGLKNTKLRKIPSEIGKLVCLQTLDLGGRSIWNVKELPASVVCLRNLMFLYLTGTPYLPAGYKKLRSLRELSRAHFTEDGDPKELRYLTELRVLGLHLSSRYPPEKLLILLESLGKLHKLHSLHVATDGNLGDWVPSSLQLEFLRLDGWYKTMPTRISSLSVPHLSFLRINVHQVRLEDIQVLGTLPVLRALHLYSDVDTTTEEERETNGSFMLGCDAFPCVTECRFPNVLFAPHMFPREAMPIVRVLQFGLLVPDILSGGDWELCIKNHPSLQRVVIKLYGEEESSERYSEAVAALKTAAAGYPNGPIIETWAY